MQAMLSDARGRTLVIEPGIGYRVDGGPYSLITNYSLLKPDSTKEFIVPGDDRYERVRVLLERWRDKRSGGCAVSDAFALLHAVRQEGIWATRVSFVYSQEEHAVYYAENNHFDHIRKYVFTPAQPGKEPL